LQGVTLVAQAEVMNHWGSFCNHAFYDL